MDDKGIGTDATIAEHIGKILQRGYAVKEGNLFKPTDLGLALYDGYESMGYHMMRVRRLLRRPVAVWCVTSRLCCVCLRYSQICGPRWSGTARAWHGESCPSTYRVPAAPQLIPVCL